MRITDKKCRNTVACGAMGLLRMCWNIDDLCMFHEKQYFVWRNMFEGRTDNLDNFYILGFSLNACFYASAVPFTYPVFLGYVSVNAHRPILMCFCVPVCTFMMLIDYMNGAHVHICIYYTDKTMQYFLNFRLTTFLIQGG